MNTIVSQEELYHLKYLISIYIAEISEISLIISVVSYVAPNSYLCSIYSYTGSIPSSYFTYVEFLFLNNYRPFRRTIVEIHKEIVQYLLDCFKKSELIKNKIIGTILFSINLLDYI